MSPRAKHLLYQEIAKLLGAGFGMRRAAETLLGLPGDQRGLLTGVIRGLDAGQSITDAFAKAGDGMVFDLEIQIIRAGERGGRLAPSFQHLAAYYEMLDHARQAVIRALMYPAVVLHLGIFVAIVPLGLMFGQSLGSLAFHFGLALLGVYVAIAVIWWALHQMTKAAPRHVGFDTWLNRIPWAGKARRNLALARFCKVYHAAVLAALPMTETVRIASQASQSARLREAGERIALRASQGEALGPGFVQQPEFPEAFARSYATGEEAGTLDTDLERWSVQFHQDAIASTRTAAAMLPKVLYFIILAFAAWQIVAFFNGYYSETFKMLDEGL